MMMVLFATALVGMASSAPVLPPLTALPSHSCGWDIAFVLDSSEGVGPEGFQKEKTFVKNFLMNMTASMGTTVSNDGIRCALIRYSSLPYAPMPFMRDQSRFFSVLDNLTYTTGFNNPTPALKMVNKNIFAYGYGDRPANDNLLIFISDGKYSGVEQPGSTADAIRANGVKFISVGVNGVMGTTGENFNKAVLERLSGGAGAASGSPVTPVFTVEEPKATSAYAAKFLTCHP